MASNSTSNRTADRDDGVTEIDPCKLVRRNNVLGFEKASGFEEVTNFDISVCGYVADGGLIIGHILEIKLAITDPRQSNVNSSRRIYLTNKDCGNHQNIVHTLTAKFKALWIAQSKEPYLPQYIFGLCSAYVKGDDPRRFIPVKVIGKQPDKDVWVFNEKVQMDRYGDLIPEDSVEFIVMEDDRLPVLKDVIGEFDQGLAIKRLLEAEKNLLQNNFPQAIMAHAASSIAANYNLVVEEFDGCATPILKGFPVSGKTTVLKAVLSVFGQRNFSSESTAKYVERTQSLYAVPFGWDDASDLKTLRSIVVNSYNACGSATLRTTYKPQTVPLVTTNLDCNDLKIKSRWLRIPFEELNPKLTGMCRIEAEANVRAAMKSSHHSIGVVTSHIHQAIKDRLGDDDFKTIITDLEEECEKIANEKGRIDQRAQNMFALMLYCAKKILKKVDLEGYFQDVWEKAVRFVIPSYLQVSPSLSSTTNVNRSSLMEDKIKEYIKHILIDTVLKATTDSVLQFFDQDFTPTTCSCGGSVTFNVAAAIQFVNEQIGCDNVHAGISPSAIRYYIKNHRIGCVGNQVRFRNSGKQVHAVHIQRSWFQSNDVKALDEKLGKRSKGHRRKGNVVNVVVDEQAAEKQGKVSDSQNTHEGKLTGDEQVPTPSDTQVVNVDEQTAEKQGQVSDALITHEGKLTGDEQVPTPSDTQGEPVLLSLQRKKRKRPNMADSLKDGLSQHELPTAGHRRRTKK